MLVIKASLSKQIGVIKVSQLSGLLPLQTRALDSLRSGRGYLGHLRCHRQCVGIFYRLIAFSVFDITYKQGCAGVSLWVLV